ncbi:NnrS family protein [Candidatus Falkowbacteria bacterium]|nr:NnrS family protein [Candidatus Falkowbacteria bacterium]
MTPTPAQLSDLWLAPHRPLFLAAGCWAFLAVLWWQWGAGLGLAPPSLGTPTLWHVHEMVFGFGAASMAAYFLTAVTSWTGRPALTGPGLQALVALWVTARAAMLGADSLPLPVLIAPGLGYFALLAGVLARDIAAARVWGKLGFPAAVAALGLVDVLFIIAARQGWALFDTVALVRAGVMFFAIKVAVIAGGMIPAFTGNWLRQVGAMVPPPRENRLANRLGLATLFAALALTLAGAEVTSGLALIIAGLVQGWRLSGWRMRAALRNPLLAMMQLTFLWLVIGLILVGVARLLPGLWPEADAVHALTMGAMSGMVMSVAARAAARREGGALIAGRLLPLAFAVLWSAAWVRVASPLFADSYAALVAAAATIWCAAWALFLVAFVPRIFGPVLRPVFSGARAAPVSIQPPADP